MVKRKQERIPVPQGGNNVIEPPSKKACNRWRGKKWLLTYSNLDESMTHETLRDHLSKLGLRRYIIARELFANGKHHWHAYIHLLAELDTTNAEWGWFRLNSCSYKRAKDFHAAEYAMKDIDYIESDGQMEFWKTSKSYRYQRDNHRIWLQDRRALMRGELKWPLECPGNVLMPAPDPAVKRRHLWIVAGADFGKTLWLNNLGRVKLFIASNERNHLEHYAGESLIIMDGMQLPWDVVEKLTDTLAQDRQCPGWARGEYVTLVGGSCRNLIYLGNHKPNYADMRLFNARFIVIDLGKPPEPLLTSGLLLLESGCVTAPL